MPIGPLSQLGLENEYHQWVTLSAGYWNDTGQQTHLLLSLLKPHQSSVFFQVFINILWKGYF